MRRRPRGRVARRKRIPRRLLNGVLGPEPRVERAQEPAARIEEIASARYGPPAEPAAEAHKRSSRFRTTPQALNDKRSSGSPNEPSRHDELLRRARPAATIPDVLLGAMSAEVKSLRLRLFRMGHSGGRCNIGGRSTHSGADLNPYTTRQSLNRNGSSPGLGGRDQLGQSLRNRPKSVGEGAACCVKRRKLRLVHQLLHISFGSPHLAVLPR
jgi:hypothetical protein